MNRRQFLLGAPAVAGLALAGQELWTPSRTIFLAPRQGWVQTPLAELWQNYARQVVPVGVWVECKEAEAFGHGFEICEGFGQVQIIVSPSIHPELERRMRASLANEPRYGYPPTFDDLTPWTRDA